MSFPPFSEETLEELFDPSTLERGYDYLHRVSELHLTQAGALFAQVQGERPQAYLCTVRLRRAGQRMRLEGQCTCPVGYACKHMAAVLLAWEAQHRPAPRRLSPLAQIWCENLSRGIADLAAPATPADEQLCYLFSRDPGGRLRLSLQVARRLIEGGFGKPRRYAGLHGEHPEFLLPEDVRLLRRWQSMLWRPDDPLPLEWGAELLEAAVATGRAYWQSITNAPLVNGGPRRGELLWRADERGGQRVAVRVDDAFPLVFPLLPPWYLEPAGGRCGALLTDLPETITQSLLLAPSLSPDDALLLTPELLQLSQRLPARLPLPAAIEVVEEAVEPIPCLHLDGLERRIGRQRVAPTLEHVNVVRLRFAYGGVEISGKDRRDLIQRAEEGRVVTMPRRLDLEAKAYARLGEVLDPIGPFRDRRDHHFSTPSLSRWFAFMSETLPALKEQGWRVTRAEGFRPRVAVVDHWHAELAEEGEWFSLGLDLELEGERHPLLPLLLRALRDQPELLDPQHMAALPGGGMMSSLPDGRLLSLPYERLQPILATLVELYQESPPLEGGRRLRLPRARSPLIADLAGTAGLAFSGGERLRELAGRLRSFQGIAAVTPPAGLAASLRSYQSEGLSWLQFLREYGFGGVLADDMGLGKTVQTLAHLLLEKEAGRLDRPALVVAPTSLMLNWRREAERFAPGLSLLTLHGLSRREQFGRIREHDLVLTTYPLLPRDEEVLQGEEFHLLILDEAQTIKNPRAKAAQVACALRARHRLCLTGTPMENHLGELWSLFHFLNPGLLGDEAEFRKLFRNPIEKQADEGRRAALARRVGPFLLRRTKAAVAKELPPKSEIVRTVELAGGQRDLYETVRIAMQEKLRAEIEKNGLQRSRIVILDALLKLRQVCCDPRLLALEGARRVKGSAKLELLMELLPEMVAEGRRVLLFSQFTSMLALIERELAALKIPYLILTGDTRDRGTPVERFQNGEVPLFLISLKAGGVGLNLTAADTVIHYDPWWNPAVERQATDRAYRIGQDKPVFVYRLMTAGTVEEKIAELQARKQALADALFDEGAAHGLEITGDDLARLFEPLG